MSLRWWLTSVLALSGCATGTPVGARAALSSSRHVPFSSPAAPRSAPPVPAEIPALQIAPGARARLVAMAREQVGRKQVELAGRQYGADCTGLIRGLFAQVGVDVMREGRPGDNGVTAIYRFAAAQGRVYDGGWPVTGDLVFFRETYDQNRDGRSNDGLTHVGLVESVRADGTIAVVHKVARGVVRYRMNLKRPGEHRDPATGDVLNDYLRMPGPARKDVLTGQLFAAYATVLPVDGVQLAGR